MDHTFDSTGVKRASNPWIVPLQAKKPQPRPLSASQLQSEKQRRLCQRPFPAYSSGSQQLSFFVEGVNRPTLSSISGAQKCLTLPDLPLLYFIFSPPSNILCMYFSARRGKTAADKEVSGRLTKLSALTFGEQKGKCCHSEEM